MSLHPTMICYVFATRLMKILWKNKMVYGKHTKKFKRGNVMHTCTQCYSHNLIWFDPIYFGNEEVFYQLISSITSSVPLNWALLSVLVYSTQGILLEKFSWQFQNHPYYIRRKVGRITLVLIYGTYVWLQFLNVFQAWTSC